MACRVARLSALLSLLLFVLDTRVVQAATNQPLCWQTGQQAYFASKKLERFEKRVPVCIVFGYQLDNRFVETPAGVAAVPKLPCEDPNGECASNRGTEKSRATAREGNQIVFFPDVDEFTVLEVENCTFLLPFVFFFYPSKRTCVLCCHVGLKATFPSVCLCVL